MTKKLAENYKSDNKISYVAHFKNQLAIAVNIFTAKFFWPSATNTHSQVLKHSNGLFSIQFIYMSLLWKEKQSE